MVNETSLHESGDAPEQRPLSKRPMFWILMVLVVLVAIIAILIGMLVVQGQAGGDDPQPTATEAQPTPEATTTTPTPEPSPTVPARVPGEIPDDCTGLYTIDWSDELDGLVLNPPWTEEPDAGSPFWGSSDTGAITVLEATTQVTCLWVGPDGASEVGLVTNVASVTADQVDSMIEYLPDNGYNCYAELDGTRCLIEQSTETGVSGESHFFRDGIWLATQWANVDADGYTHDMISTIWT